MEKLEPTARKSIEKMNTDRLRMKLAIAGVNAEEVAGMSREQLMHAWAEIVLIVAAGGEVVAGKAEAAAAVTAKIPAYDVELERQRLAFEMKKIEEEMAWRKQKKEERLAREEAEKEEKLAREEAERAERLAEKEEKLAREATERAERLAEKEERLAREATERADRIAFYKLQEMEFMRQRDRDERDHERQNTLAVRAKFFGDVLKNVMPKFPNDVADTPIFFEGVEKLFASFAVPAELQSKLLLPYLNDKAKALLLRLDKTKQDDYDEVKKFLLREFKLTPVQFKNRFDHATRNSDETYVMFCARLKNYLTYYCHSRAIDGSFDNFFSLCVADKLKSTLSEACLDHVLTAEGNTWQKCDDLADTIDTYLANHTHDGRTKTSNSANASKQHFNASDVNSSRKWNVNNSRGGNGNASVNNRGSSNASFTNKTQENKNSKFASNANPASIKGKGLCYICQSPSHRQFNCPLRGGQATSEGQPSASARTPASRNFACTVDNTVTGPIRDGPTGAITDVAVAMCIEPTDCDGQVASTATAVQRSASGETIKPETGRRTELTFHSARAAIGDVDPTDSNQLNMHNFSKLTYIPICVRVVTRCHDALHDSGSQVNLIKSELLRQLPEMPTAGRISIKGIVGPAIETDLVSLEIKPAPTDDNCVNIAPHLTEIFAVCDELNEGIILTDDTVKRLTALNDYDTLIAVNQVTATEINDGTVDTNADTSVDVQVTESPAKMNTGANDDRRDCIDVPDCLHTETDLKSADTVTLIKEQHEDSNLSKYFDMANNGNKLFFCARWHFISSW
jgi:hypothetical protein